MVTCIEKLGELREHPNVKGEDNPDPSLIMKNKKIKVECATCGKSKEMTPYEFNKNTTGNFYCDDECLRKGFSKTNKGKGNPFYNKKHSKEALKKMTGKNHWNYGNRKHKDKECPECLKTFNKRTKYCCADCSHKARRKRISKPCGWCGKDVTRVKCYAKMYKNFFCNSSCNGKYNGAKQPTGVDAYWYGKRKEETPNWQNGLSFEPYGTDFDNELKEEVRARDNYICQICGISQDELGRKLDVHHIDYDKTNNKKENLTSLCRKNGCHQITNGNREYWTSRLKKHNQKGATTIPDGEVHYKLMVDGSAEHPILQDDDIVCSHRKL